MLTLCNYVKCAPVFLLYLSCHYHKYSFLQLFSRTLKKAILRNLAIFEIQEAANDINYSDLQHMKIKKKGINFFE